jgi:hypothetical protein
MSRIRACLTGLAIIGLTSSASGQSPFTFCADTVPNRIISTGPVRAVVATVDSLRVCLAAEGFSDSAVLHPRNWPNPSRLSILVAIDAQPDPGFD